MINNLVEDNEDHHDDFVHRLKNLDFVGNILSKICDYMEIDNIKSNHLGHFKILEFQNRLNNFLFGWSFFIVF